MPTGVEVNQAIYDRDAEEYLLYALMRPELRLLELLRDRWGSIDMLDLGIGAGRTSWTFAALCRRYVGVDYSPRLVEMAKRNIAESERVQIMLGDARDLSAHYDDGFDVVMFSFNGIDSVDHESRLAIFAEARKVVRDDGCFYFSSHSLKALPFRRELVMPSPRRPLSSGLAFARSVRKSARMRRSNLELDRATVERQGWALVRDIAHDFQLILYYVMPEHQLEQLANAGFTVEAVYDTEGREVDARNPGRHVWLHYLCRPVV